MERWLGPGDAERAEPVRDGREANERMQRLVRCDEKTELFNYRPFMNDRHGHVAGDRVLRQFAQIMSRTARETDPVDAADHALYRARDMRRNRSDVDERSLVALLSAARRSVLFAGGQDGVFCPEA